MDELHSKAQELQQAALEADKTQEEVSSSAVPQVQLSAAGLNKLISVVNKVVDLFDVSAVPDATEDGLISQELFNVLMMIIDSATEGGFDNIPSLESLTSEKQLPMFIAEVTALVNNQEYKNFLRSPSKEGSAPEGATEEPATEAAPSEQQMRDMFISKLK